MTNIKTKVIKKNRVACSSLFIAYLLFFKKKFGDCNTFKIKRDLISELTLKNCSGKLYT